MGSFKNETIRGKILARIEEINDSFPNKKTSPQFRIRFNAKENDMLYKHICDYAKIKFGVKTKKEDYIVNVGVWQEYLVREWLDKIDLSDIQVTERSDDFFREERQDSSKSGENSEKIQCRKLKYSHNSAMGELLDFQVPLKARKNEMQETHKEHKGELDLVARQGDRMVLIEYKIPDSTEPLLRAVLEAITYYYQIDGSRPEQSKYLQAFNKTFSLKCNQVGIAIVVPEIAYRFGHKRAFQLIKDYNITCYTFNGKEKEFENIVMLSQKQIDDYCKEANEHLKAIYEYSDDIVDKIELR